jgi:hypothetical protein
LKPERWGSLLVQKKHQEEKACDKRHPYCIIIIIIIIIIRIIIMRMWNVKTKVIPVIMGATGTISDI